MIASLAGKLTSKKPDYIIVEVQGIGYGIHVPLSTFYALPDEGSEVLLKIHTHVREDALELFGFLTEREKEVFKLLINVAGLGPREAINILSGMETEDLVDAVINSNIPKLQTIPRVGRKKAQKIVLELQDKMLKLKAEWLRQKDKGEKEVIRIREKSEIARDAESALINLGYRKSEARRAVEEAISHMDKTSKGEINLEDLLRTSLKNLTR